ncbi:MAG TPA: glycosyltransferase family 4 protein [Planctomycetota bacterium]|nr:glycosyltransferase family 4 protein [Planctomycetota bacterium]
MRALTIIQADFHRHWGGQAEVVLALSKALAARSHRITIACPPTKVTAGKTEESDLSARAREAGIPVFSECNFTKGFKPLSLLRDVRRLGSLLQKEKPDIYHCHGSQDHWIGALAIRKFSPTTKLIRTRHNIYPIHNHAANRWLFRKKTAQVVCIFGDQKKFFTDCGLLEAERLAVLHSPLPQEFVSAPSVERAVRRELKLSDATPLVGFVANFHPDKAPLDFVATAARVMKLHRDVHFAMAGHGPLDEPIRAELARLDLGSRFHMLGFRKDMVNVMASFDLLALTSVTREASSTVLKQAGAMGVPVIATDVGGTREVVDDGRTGILVKPGDVDALTMAVLALLNDPAKSRAMGEAGRKKVLSEFTAAAIAERTEALYFQALEKR